MLLSDPAADRCGGDDDAAGNQHDADGVICFKRFTKKKRGHDNRDGWHHVKRDAGRGGAENADRMGEAIKGKQ
ncbi:hypothetical protein D3C78_1807570 [compost metagenome]